MLSNTFEQTVHGCVFCDEQLVQVKMSGDKERLTLAQRLANLVRRQQSEEAVIPAIAIQPPDDIETKSPDAFDAHSHALPSHPPGFHTGSTGGGHTRSAVSHEASTVARSHSESDNEDEGIMPQLDEEVNEADGALVEDDGGGKVQVKRQRQRIRLHGIDIPNFPYDTLPFYAPFLSELYIDHDGKHPFC
jgi:hypothetical protein